MLLQSNVVNCQKLIRFCGQEVILACDGQCDKAWGINARPKNKLSDDEDDYEWLADTELGEAPWPGDICEGGDCKPKWPHPDLMNRWCARECERHCMTKPGDLIVLDDFSKRIPNMHWRRVNDTTTSPPA